MKRTFELMSDERYQGRSNTMYCNNQGDKDSLLFGNLELDDRDRQEGWGQGHDFDYQVYKSLVDAEYKEEEAQGKIDELEEDLEFIKELGLQAKAKLESYRKGTPSYNYYGMKVMSLRDWYSRTKDKLEYQKSTLHWAESVIKFATEGKVADSDDRPEEEYKYNSIHWGAVCRYGEEQVDRVRREVHTYTREYIHELINTYTTKNRRKELTFRHFVELKGMLHKQAWYEVKSLKAKDFHAGQVRKMKELWTKYDLGTKKGFEPEFREVLVDTETPVFASMNLNMEEAIDMMADAKRVASRHNVTVEEAFEMLFDRE